VKRSGHAAERASGARIKGKRIEVGLGLLELGLTRGTLTLVVSDKRSNRELSERDGGNQRLRRQDTCVGDSP
jgi:hypothetical protein